MEKRQKITLILLLFYCGTLGCFLLGRDTMQINNPILYWDYIRRNIQLIPVKTVHKMISIAFSQEFSTNARILAALNLGGNLMMLAPCGFLVPLSFPKMKHISYFLPCILLFILIIEAIQLFTLRGSFDIDDVILNTIGAIVGLDFYDKIDKRKSAQSCGN